MLYRSTSKESVGSYLFLICFPVVLVHHQKDEILFFIIFLVCSHLFCNFSLVYLTCGRTTDPIAFQSREGDTIQFQSDSCWTRMEMRPRIIGKVNNARFRERLRVGPPLAQVVVARLATISAALRILRDVRSWTRTRGANRSSPMVRGRSTARQGPAKSTTTSS